MRAGFPFGCHAGRRAAVTAAALAATLGLAAVCWVVAVRQMNGMDMRLPPGVVRSGVFAGVWVAMMLPGAVPAVVRRAHVSGRVWAVPLFVGSYLAVWALVGVAVYGLYRPHGSLAAGAVVIAAGACELTRPSGASAGPAARAPARDWRSGSAASVRASG